MGWREIFGLPRKRWDYRDYYEEYAQECRREREQQRMLDANLNPKQKATTEKKDEHKASNTVKDKEEIKKELNVDKEHTQRTPSEGKEEEKKKSDMSPLNGVNKEDLTPGEKHKESDKEKDERVFFIPIRKEKKDVIIFVVENSSMVNQYKTEISKIISKIVNDNDKCLFKFLRVGNNKKYFDIMDCESLRQEKMIENLFLPDEEEKSNVDYFNVLSHIDNFLSSILIDLDYKGKKYDIQNKNIIFFGTGEYELSEKSETETRMLIRKIKARSKMKNIRYFCIKDSQTINLASLGFPVIGHIVADFYK